MPSFRLAPVPVGTAMHRGVITCHPESSMAAVVRMMAAHRIHSVLVVADDGVCTVILCDADVERVLAAGALSTTTAGEIATAPLTVDPTASISRAVELMNEHCTTHAVVADPATKRAVGVLSVLDVAEALEGGDEP